MSEIEADESEPGRATDRDHGGADLDRGREVASLRRAPRLVRHMLPYLGPYWREAAGSVALIVVLVVVSVAQPWPLAFVADTVLDDAREPPGWVAGVFGNGSTSLILFAVLATLLITLASGAATVAQQYLTVRINEGMSLDFRSRIFGHVQRLSMAWHDDRETGMLLFRLNTQSRAIGHLATALPIIAQNLLTVIAMGYVTYRIDPVLGLVATAVVPLVFVSIRFYADRIEPQLLRVRGMEGRNMSIVHEAMQMMRIVVAFGRQDHEYTRFRSQGADTAEARVNLTLRQTTFRMGVALLTAVGTAAVLGIGASRVLGGNISLGELLVVLAYVAAVYAPLEAMTSLIVGYQTHLIGFEHALELLEEQPDIVESPDATDIERAQGALSMQAVSFSYPNRPNTLVDISFDIEPGTSLAIVGPTGAGKSTLVSLIPRFYDADRGTVAIDGCDVRDFTLDSLRQQFSIVLQEPLLFSGSIAENLRYAKPDATPAEVRQAAENANAHEFISRLPMGYQTRLGERGAKLSGGERQRLAIARAFLRDAPFIILDEPTSSIDSRTEGPVLEALERLRAGRTAIVIAHRLATVRNADRVLVLEDGHAVQFGTFDDLVATDGLLRTLWSAQTGIEQDGDPLDADASTAEIVPVSFDDDLVIVPTSRHPLELEPETIDAVWQAPIPARLHPWSPDPLASILVPVHGNLVVTRLGLESILATEGPSDFEVVIVDDGSDDLTARYLHRLKETNPNVRLIRNDANRGFGPAVNQALAAARGEIFVIANNDIVATPGWLTGLVQSLSDDEIGLAGPVTNRCGNEAEVPAHYRTYGELLEVAKTHRWGTPTVTDIATSIMFCTAMRRETYEAVGELDERFEIGMFEDDDYSRRVRESGRRVVCVESVFVHHFGEATFGSIEANGELFHANRERFERKWREPWKPHGRRIDPAYDALRNRVRELIAEHTPVGADVAVVSHGDDRLVDLDGRIGRHFPSQDDGTYLGHHPADDTEAIHRLERMCRRGTTFLVVPETSAWWLVSYPRFAQHLDQAGRRVIEVDGVASIFEVQPLGRTGAPR